MNPKFILDQQLGGKVRALLVQISMVIVVALGFLDQIEAAGWTVTPALIVSIIGNWFKIGNVKQ